MDVLISNIGIESFSTFEEEHPIPSLPSRYALTPDGEAVERYVNALFDLHPSDNLVQQFLYPKVLDCGLFRPTQYRKVLESTRQYFSQQLASDHSANQVLAVLDELSENQRWLTLCQSMLVKA